MSKLLQGIPPEYHAIARQYVTAWKRLGWSDDQCDRGLQWGVTHLNAPGDHAADFQTFVQTKLGMDNTAAATATNISETLMTSINDGTVELKQPELDETGRLLADIKQYRQQHPDAWSQDKAMQAAELRLIDVKLGNAPSDPSVTTAAPPQSAGAARMAEIRGIMRDDPNRYNSDRKLQAEQLSLIEASLSKASPADQSPSPQSSTAAAPLSKQAQFRTAAINNIREYRRKYPDHTGSDAVEREYIEANLAEQASLPSSQPSSQQSAPAPTASEGTAE